MNLKKITFLSLLNILMISSLQAQEETKSSPKEPSNWKLESIFSLNVTQSSFTNWASGGRNNISGLGFINASRSEEHTSELQSRPHLVCRLLLEKKKTHTQFSLY